FRVNVNLGHTAPVKSRLNPRAGRFTIIPPFAHGQAFSFGLAVSLDGGIEYGPDAGSPGKKLNAEATLHSTEPGPPGKEDDDGFNRQITAFEMPTGTGSDCQLRWQESVSWARRVVGS